MRKLKKIVATAMVALPLVASVTLVGASAAQASEGVNMSLVCQHTAGKTSYAARTINQTANGWECYDRALYKPGPTMSADIWSYCVNVLGYGGAYNTVGGAYNWYCA